jgi:hypothetical protein
LEGVVDAGRLLLVDLPVSGFVSFLSLVLFFGLNYAAAQQACRIVWLLYINIAGRKPVSWNSLFLKYYYVF